MKWVFPAPREPSTRKHFSKLGLETILRSAPSRKCASLSGGQQIRVAASKQRDPGGRECLPLVVVDDFEEFLPPIDTVNHRFGCTRGRFPSGTAQTGPRGDDQSSR